MGKLPIEIQTNVDGQLVRGRIVNLCQRSIAVEILTPFEGICQGCSFPAFAMPAVVAGGHAYGDHSGLTRAGRESAEDLLETLHRSCLFFEKNQKRLRGDFYLIRQHEELAARFDGPAFHAIRARLRARMKSGELTGPEYQRVLAPLAQKYRAFKSLRQRVESRLEEVILSKYGMLIPSETLEQLIQKFLV